ncbi:hypothetical protein C6990_07610 [Nitrosopumilus sp. b3]|nr:hypothetical protein C6990_07610 [Nitrosopumilus sp. b3]
MFLRISLILMGELILCIKRPLGMGSCNASCGVDNNCCRSWKNISYKPDKEITKIPMLIRKISIPILEHLHISYMLKIILYYMKKRITIMIDEDLDKKLRVYQAKTIQKNQSSYSYSQALNESLRKIL